jgi:hypothetical protein
MVTHIDEKGKIYTNIIQKQAVWVTLQLANSRVHGLIYIRSNERIKETLDAQETFLALTQAEIFSADGTISQLKTNFLAVNKFQIIWILPDLEMAGSE